MGRVSPNVLRHAATSLVRTRTAVLEVLGAHPHQYLGAEDIFRGLLERHRPLSLGTVYRALRSLADEGRILREWAPTLRASGKRVYRLKPTHYEDRGTRLVCRQCRRSVVLADEGLREHLIQVAQRHGLRVSDQPMTVQVVCFDKSTCQFKQQDAPEVQVEALA